MLSLAFISLTFVSGVRIGKPEDFPVLFLLHEYIISALFVILMLSPINFVNMLQVTVLLLQHLTHMALIVNVAVLRKAFSRIL